MRTYKISNRIGTMVLIILGISTSAYVLNIRQLWREITQREADAIDIKLPSLSPIVERSQKAVVVIRTEAVIEHQPMAIPGLPFYMPMPPQKMQGQGSGFILNEEGYVVTNQHVIEDAKKIMVTVGIDAGDYEAEVIGAEKELDIALLKLKSGPDQKMVWPYLPLGNSETIRLGDWVMALGSPLGLVQSVNFGIVAQKHRGGIKPSGRELFVELMQLQMPINPGNSGGPIVDTAGRVVAVCESILASGQSIAFGVPINIVKDVIEQLRLYGRVRKSQLGIQPANIEDAKGLGLPHNTKGAVIVRVFKDKPAQKAGLKPMDVILEIDGKPVNDDFGLRQYTAYKPIGSEVTLKIYRKGEGYINRKVILEARDDEDNETKSKPDAAPNNVIKIDTSDFTISVRDVSKPDQKGHVPDDSFGVEVIEVTKKQSYNLLDLNKGDMITQIDSTVIKSAKQIKSIFDKTKKGTKLMMIRYRGESARVISITK